MFFDWVPSDFAPPVQPQLQPQLNVAQNYSALPHHRIEAAAVGRIKNAIQVFGSYDGIYALPNSHCEKLDFCESPPEFFLHRIANGFKRSSSEMRASSSKEGYVSFFPAKTPPDLLGFLVSLQPISRWKRNRRIKIYQQHYRLQQLHFKGKVPGAHTHAGAKVYRG